MNQFRLPIIIFGTLFFVCLSSAMALYQGASQFLLYDSGYSQVHNFLSDLGISESYNHQPVSNVINILFGYALFSAGIATALFFFQQSLRLKGTVKKILPALGVLTWLSVSLIPLIPSDDYVWPHRIVTVLTLIILAIACTALSMAAPERTFQSAGLRVFTVLLWLYLLFLFLGPLPNSSLLARMVHALSQKGIIYGFMIVVSLFQFFPIRNETNEDFA
ncbi:MAG: hypothetical protein K0S20_264 [Patescibacteria group bacterium]|jgi:hypothetical membrane protein|nr:hypothetical protein [Patescibacteria group bacterium]